MQRPDCLSDTQIRCKDGILYGERSLLYRLSENFADQLCERAEDWYILHLEEELTGTVVLLLQVLRQNIENYNLLRGPSREEVRRNGFCLKGPDRLIFAEFCFRNQLGQATLPLIYRPTDDLELQRLLELVYQHQEQFDDTDEQYAETIDLLVRKFIRRAEKNLCLRLTIWCLVWESLQEERHLRSKRDWQMRFLRAFDWSGHPLSALAEIAEWKMLRAGAEAMLREYLQS